MTNPERDRHELYQRLDEVLGHQPATTLMDLLPPVGWADVARRSDLDAIHRELADCARRSDLTELELRLERSIRDMFRTSLYANLGAMAAVTAAVVAAARL